jgi:hypothetical protein
MASSSKLLLLSAAALVYLAGCQHPQNAPAPSSPIQGAAIDAPAAGRPTGFGQRQAPDDPAARAQLAVEAPAPVGKDGFTPISFSELSDFVYKTDAGGKLTPESNLPEEISKLDKSKAAISGFIVPIEYKEDKVRSMILVRNQLLCCFGQEPKLNEWVFVNIDPPVDAVMDVPVTLFGTFYAGPDREEGQVISLYRMEATEMEAMP